MTDSTFDEQSGEGGADVGPSLDELFGGLEPDPVEDERRDRRESEADASGHNADAGGTAIEDRTATDVFTELQAEAGEPAGGADDLLADESPEEIIRSLESDDGARGPGDEPRADEDLLADENALADLLLTGRTKEDEFLWVDSGADDESDPGAESGVDDTLERTGPATDEGDALAESPGGERDEEGGDGSVAAPDPDGTDPGDGDEPNADPTAPPKGDEWQVPTTLDGTPGSESTELVLDDEDEAEGDGGVVAWLRSKLGGLF